MTKYVKKMSMGWQTEKQKLNNSDALKDYSDYEDNEKEYINYKVVELVNQYRHSLSAPFRTPLS